MVGKKRRAKQRWDMKQARKIIPKILLMLVWTFAAVVVSQLVVGCLMLWVLGADRLSEAVWTAVFSAISYSLAMVLVLGLPKKITLKYKERKFELAPRANRNGLGLRGLPTWTDIGLAPAGFIVYLLLASGLVAVFEMFPWFNAEEAQKLGFNIFIFGLDRVAAFIALVVVAPIAEEVIFRGWLYGKMRESLSMWLSILLVSALFGLVHMQWNVGVNVFAMSVVLCGLREITGTIYAGILLHMLKNGVAFYLLFVMGI